jgi:hypothetical protein
MSLKRCIKMLGLALMAMFAFSAVAVGAAQANAPHFTVNGSTSFGSQTITGSSTGVVTLSVPSLGVTLKTGAVNGECTAHGFITSSATGEPSKNKEVIVTCHNLEAFTSAGATITTCTIHSPGQANGTVVTSKMESTLVWTAASGDASVGDLFQVEGNTTTGNFFSLEFTGAECPLAGSLNTTGGMIATVSANAITADTTSGSLTFPPTADKEYWTNQTPTRTKDTITGLKFGTNSAVLGAVFDLSSEGKSVGIEPN